MFASIFFNVSSSNEYCQHFICTFKVSNEFFFFCFIMQIEARRQTVLFDLLQKLKINNYLSASPHVVLLLGEPSHQLQYAIQPKPYEYNCSMWMFPPLKSLPWLLPAHMMVGYFHILVLKHKAAPVENLGTGW